MYRVSLYRFEFIRRNSSEEIHPKKFIRRNSSDEIHPMKLSRALVFRGWIAGGLVDQVFFINDTTGIYNLAKAVADE